MLANHQFLAGVGSLSRLISKRRFRRGKTFRNPIGVLGGRITLLCCLPFVCLVLHSLLSLLSFRRRFTSPLLFPMTSLALPRSLALWPLLLSAWDMFSIPSRVTSVRETFNSNGIG